MVSPLVVLYCLQQQTCVPKAEKPIYNMAMADITICCTSLDKAVRVSSLNLWRLTVCWVRVQPFTPSVSLQMDVMDLVHLMGGRVYLDLNVSVTHLIAGEVGSKKYLVAASLGKPILQPSWVHACWEKSQERYGDHCFYNSQFKYLFCVLLMFFVHFSIHQQSFSAHRPATWGLFVSSAARLHSFCYRLVQHRT